MKHRTSRRARCPRPDKTAHRDKQRATVAARGFARDLNSRGLYFRPIYGYQCACGRWHITSRADFNGQPNELLWAAPRDLQDWAMGRVPTEMRRRTLRSAQQP